MQGPGKKQMACSNWVMEDSVTKDCLQVYVGQGKPARDGTGPGPATSGSHHHLQAQRQREGKAASQGSRDIRCLMGAECRGRSLSTI